MEKPSRLLPWIALLALTITPFSLQAATPNALVTGSVFDRSGAPLEGASVRLLNPSIGFSQNQNTDADGTFTFPSVPPAEDYFLSVEKAGFATQIRPGIQVTVAEVKMVLPPFLLQPAAPAVTAPSPAAPQPPTPAGAAQQPQTPEPATQPTISLDLLSSTLGGVIDSRIIRTLPLANRDFFDLALLVPGTYPTEQGSPLEGASLVVNGVRANMNNFLLDGVDNNDYTINQALPFQIVEAMQEFRVQTSASTAEYGRNGGAQINTISRSGVNTLHGSLFEFNRNSALSSLNALSAYRGGTFDAFAQSARVDKILFGPYFFDPTACATSNWCWGGFYPTSVLSDPVLSRIFDSGRDPHFNQNQFGTNLGGRLVKDKAFFFLNWESFRAQDPRPVFERVPDDTCRDPNTCAALVGPSYGWTTPLCPVSAGLIGKLLSLYPAPNVPSSSVKDAFGNPVSDPLTGDKSLSWFTPDGAFFAGQSQNFTHSDNVLDRVDLRPSDRLSMSFKHNIQRIYQIQGGSLPQTSAYPGNGTTVSGRNQNFSYNLVGDISDRTVNEFRVGWNRFRLTSLPLDHTLDPSGIFNNLNFTDKGLPSLLIGGFDRTEGPYADLGASFASPSNRADNVTSVADNLSFTRGRHVLKFGGEFRHNRLNVDNEGAGRGLVSFFSVPWAASINLPDLASIARVSPAFGGGFDRSFHANFLDWFVQDTWRARSNVTFTLGLRHEINQAPIEALNRLINNYPYICNDPFTGLPSPICLMHVGDATNAIYDSDGARKGTASFMAPRAGFNTGFRDFGPHFGLAWDPGNKGKTVFRTGYELTFDQMSLQPSVSMLLNPPEVQQAMAYSRTFTESSTFPPGFPHPSSDSPLNCANAFAGYDCWNTQGPLQGQGIFTFSGEYSQWFARPYSITARDPNTRTPYVHQFYGGIQQRLGNKAIFELAYVGSLGHKLLRNRLLLQCPEQLLEGGITASNPAGPMACVPNGFIFWYRGTAPGLGAATDSVINQETSANSNFHSLQASFDTRAFHGLTLHVHYMWAHSIDNASASNPPVFLLSPATASLLSFLQSINSDQFAALNNANPTLSLRPGLPSVISRGLLPSDSQNSSNLSGERASSDFDIRHRLVVYYTYDFPKVSGLRGLGNGWQVAGITTFQKGQPFTVFGDFFGVPLRPNLVGAAAINNSDPDSAIDNAVPAGCAPTFCLGTSATSAFDNTPSSSFSPGSLPRNSFIGPRLVNFDLSILKNTYLGAGGRRNLQFRMEFFNLFNQVNYRQPFSQEGQFVSSPPGLICGYDNSGNPVPCPSAGWFIWNPFFGQILQAHDPRSVQFALKLIF